MDDYTCLKDQTQAEDVHVMHFFWPKLHSGRKARPRSPGQSPGRAGCRGAVVDIARRITLGSWTRFTAAPRTTVIWSSVPGPPSPVPEPPSPVIFPSPHLPLSHSLPLSLTPSPPHSLTPSLIHSLTKSLPHKVPPSPCKTTNVLVKYLGLCYIQNEFNRRIEHATPPIHTADLL